MNTTPNIREIAPATPLIPGTASDQLKRAMRHVAGTVSVVTAGDLENRTGATVTSATALSVEPPTMIVNINRASSTWPIIARHRHFCVNILNEESQSIAERFSGMGGLKGGQRYDGAVWTELASGAAALIGSVASIDCEVEEIIERHSHAIIIGRVLDVSIGGGSPLIYSHGKYGSLADPG